MTQDKRRDLIDQNPGLITNPGADSAPVTSVQPRAAFKKGAAARSAPATNPTSNTAKTVNQPLPMWLENKVELEEEKKDPMFRAWVHQVFNFDEPFVRSADDTLSIVQALKHYASNFQQLDEEDRQARCLASQNVDGDYGPSTSTGYGSYDILGRGSHRPAGRHGSALIEIPPLTKMQVGERQAAVNSLLPKAAAEIGVSPEIMKGIWYKETKFSTLKEVSSTGCIGPWQFTRGTFAENILAHGDEMARSLKANGYDDEAASVAKYHYALRTKSIGANDRGLQSLRMNTAISTLAATHYVADIARRQGLDATDVRNGGKLYAAYNVGEGSLDKLERLAASGSAASAKETLGWVADVNPQFYKNGANAREVLQNYQTAIEHGIKQHAFTFTGNNNTALAQNRADITQIASAAPTVTDRKPASRMDQVLRTLGITSPEPS